jgi:hypothetical protein
MFLGLLTLLTALVISSVAVYYSVSGLAAIFAGAAIPIIIMGTALEVGKLVVATWLHYHWKKSPLLLRSYFIIATFILMLITSMGIFGFLSRAHIEQGAPIGDVNSQIEIIDQKIAAKKGDIEQAKTATKNLDDVVAQYLLKGKDEKSVAAANNARKSQQKERDKLAKQIDDDQNSINKLNEEKLPLTQKVHKIETEVGPIKYIAAFIYGNNPGQDLLEKAVTWVIMIIIFVFDPMAVLLLIASQISFKQALEARRDKKLAREEKKEPILETKKEETNAPQHEPDDVRYSSQPEPVIDEPVVVPPVVETNVQNIETLAVFTIPPVVDADHQEPKEQIIDTIAEKKDVVIPNDVIMPDNAGILLEQALFTPYNQLSDRIVVENTEAETYVQNSEQSEDSLWQRVQRNRKIFKPEDILQREFELNSFKDIDLSNQDQTDPEIQSLIKYVESVKLKQMRLDDIPIYYREKLADLITRG